MANGLLTVRNSSYMIDGPVGYGLHSIVYGAHDTHTGQPVAIKVIDFSSFNAHGLSSSSKRNTFWKELNMLLSLQSLNPYIIRVFNHDYQNQYGAIVMERGIALRKTIDAFMLTRTMMPVSMIQLFWSQMVEAIYFLHQIGIVHGDCKPENFIQTGSDGTQLRLIDMGTSFSLSHNQTSQLRAMIGTPDYVSPEMINGRVGFSSMSRYGYKADIWALGIILFEMTFGFRPLQNIGGKETKIEFLEQLSTDLEIPYHPDKKLRDAIKKCLKSNPNRRPTSKTLLSHPFLMKNYEIDD